MTDHQFGQLMDEIHHLRDRLEEHLSVASQRSSALAVLESRVPGLERLERRVSRLEQAKSWTVGFAAGGGFLGAGTMAAIWRLMGLDT